ncbi:hypothetical protein G5714_016798 [Onychostoma macrolepis]|uniref:Uncharacterized protein n=1 Tax=Onychostoma macrolepis TaxID=369639 RepID=A0A7J6C3Y2_9TELE|nr:hypothetical protein G5714_016798 [Onychostoma macrolepis]
MEHFWETFNQPDPTTTYDFDVEDAQEKLQLHHATTALEGEAGKVGLRISAKKSKIMHMSNTAQTWGVTIGTQQLEEVEMFTYLGSLISQNGNAEVDVKWLNREGGSCFSEDKQDLGPHLSTVPMHRCVRNECTKLHLFTAIVVLIAMYAVFMITSPMKRYFERVARANFITSSPVEDSNWPATSSVWRTTGSPRRPCDRYPLAPNDHEDAPGTPGEEHSYKI